MAICSEFISISASKACSQRLYMALEKHTRSRGPTIMASQEREVVTFENRDRQVMMEQDLETNFELVRECIYVCMEMSLQLPPREDGKFNEIPNLSEFEAGLGNNYWTMF